MPCRTVPYHATPSYHIASYVAHSLQHHIRHHIIYQFRTQVICIIPNHIMIYNDAPHRILSHRFISRSIELLYHTPHHIIYQNSCRTESHRTMRHRIVMYNFISLAAVSKSLSVFRCNFLSKISGVVPNLSLDGVCIPERQLSNEYAPL